MKGNFVMRGFTLRTVNKYYHDVCRKKKIKHKVIYVKGPETNSSSQWGSGIPTTRRKCTGCGATDGPWVDAKYAGE